MNNTQKEYDTNFIFTKLKKRVENTKPKQIKKIKIGEPVKIDLEVINLEVVE